MKPWSSARPSVWRISPVSRESDPELCHEVRSLLEADESAEPGFLSTPPLVAMGLPPLQSSFVGRRLGAWKLIEVIGAGGMGEVYKAVRADDEYQHEVAIKLVHSGHGPSFVGNRFRTERQILASLQHPNIAGLLDGGTTSEGTTYLVMELIDGQPITDYCDEHKLDTAARVKLFIQVCAAVQYAHQHMVIHRDLKPSNILVTRDGVPKLLDFGIAKILDPGAAPDNAGLTVARARHPHARVCEPRAASRRVGHDSERCVFAGRPALRATYGSRPYEIPSGAPHAVRLAAIESAPKRPSTLVRQHDSAVDGSAEPRARSATREASPEKLHRRLRGDLDNVVLMALRKEPERRYGTADQLADDLRRHLHHRPVLARAPTMGYLVATFVARHTIAVVASALFAAALIGGVIAIAREARIAEEHRAQAEHRFNEVRKLANALIFDIDDKISNLPAAAASRRLVIDTAIQYLASLSKEAEGDPEFQIEMAEAYRRLGDVQGSLVASQDDYGGALKSYQRAIALLGAVIAADPDNVRARRDIAVVHHSLSDLLWVTGDGTGSLSYAWRAFTDSRELAPSSASSGDPESLYWVALYGTDYGYKVFRIHGDAAVALDYMRSSLTALEPLVRAPSSNARVRRTLAVAYYKMSEVLIHERGYTEALLLLQKSGQLLETAIAAAPQDPDLRVNEAAVAHYSAAALMNLGRLDEAATQEEKALATVRAVLADDPRVPEFQGFVGMALTALADISVREGQAAKAIALLQESLRASEAALNAGTKHPYIRYSKAKTESLLGTTYAMLAADPYRTARERMQRWRDARDWYRRATLSFQEITSIWKEAAGDVERVSEEIARCEQMLRVEDTIVR